MASNAMAAASTISIDRYVIDCLMRDLVGHDRSPSAFIVYLTIVAAAAEGRVFLSHTAVADRTGLSKRACQNAVAHLARRGLIESRRSGVTEIAEYQPRRPWVR